MDPFYLMLGAQGLSNTLANIGSMQRGRGQVANNAPLLGMAMQYKQQQQEEGRNQKIADSLQNDPSLSDQEKAVLSQVAMNGGDVTGYLARKMAVDAKDERSPFQVVGGSLARIPSDPNGTPEWFTPPSASQDKVPSGWRLTPTGSLEPVPGGPASIDYIRAAADARAKEAGGGGGGGGGGSALDMGGRTATERMMRTYIGLEQKRASGATLTPTEEANRRMLGFQLGSLKAGPSGQIDFVPPPDLFAGGNGSAPASTSIETVRAPVPSEADADREAKRAQNDKTMDAGLSLAKNMLGRLEKDPSIAGSVGFVRRQKETVLGNVYPGASQPALNYQQDLEYLRNLSWKQIMNDTRLSDPDRERLDKVVNGSEAFSTPETAKRSLQIVSDVLSRMKSGTSSDAPPHVSPKSAAPAPAPATKIKVIEPAPPENSSIAQTLMKQYNVDYPTFVKEWEKAH